MFSDFFEISQRRCYFSNHGAHPSKGCSLQRFASIQRISVFDKFEVVSTHVFDHVLGGFDVTQRQLEMVFVVEDVEKVAVEGVDVFYFGEVVEDVD